MTIINQHMKDKKPKRFSGVVVPAVTPLTAENKLDEQAVEKMFRLFADHHVHPFILGTTGESSSLPLSMKTAYIKLAGKLKQAGVTLYAGISSNCVEETVAFAKLCFDSGADIVAATLPSYYPLTESQMKKYFEQIAEQVPGPLIIYNIPATTHMSIPLPVIDQLSYHENIAGTKDSEKNEARLKESLELWKDREDFSHFTGWAAKSAEALMAGGDGMIPSTGNLFPEIYDDMIAAVRNGDVRKAVTLQRWSDLLGDVYQKGRTLGESLAALKVLMKAAGLCEAYMMQPLQRATASEEKELINHQEQIINKEGIQLSRKFSNA